MRSFRADDRCERFAGAYREELGGRRYWRLWRSMTREYTFIERIETWDDHPDRDTVKELLVGGQPRIQASRATYGDGAVDGAHNLRLIRAAERERPAEFSLGCACCKSLLASRLPRTRP